MSDRKQEIYNAQDEVFEDEDLLSMEQTRDFFYKVTMSVYFKALCKLNLNLKFVFKGNSEYKPTTKTVYIYHPTHLTESVILHELAHCLACYDKGTDKRGGGHGEVFISNYLTLVSEFISIEKMKELKGKINEQ